MLYNNQNQEQMETKKNWDFRIETIKINPQSKWEYEAKILTFWDKAGKHSMRIYEDTDVDIIIQSLSNM